MLKTRCLVFSLCCSLIAVATRARAQATDTTRKETENFVRDLIRGLVGPNWNVFAHGGVATSERFLLQQAVDPADGKRSLQTATGYNVGGGVGVDALLHLGLRASFTFSSNNMNFRTDNGDGSNALNMNDVARLKSYTGTVEAMRYMLTSRAPISPYGSLGLQCTWWSLDEKSPFVTSAGAGTPFSISPIFSFGVQAKASDHWSGRLEAALASGKNPFTGQHSFQSNLGQTIDEPASINQTAFRVAAVYHFGRPPKVTIPAPAVAQH
jgi:hypothetical protein